MSEKKNLIYTTTSTPWEARSYDGIVFSITDGQQPQAPLERPVRYEDALNWFQAYPEEVESPILKLLTCQISSGDVRNGFDIPFSMRVIDEAIWQSKVYTDWSNMDSGACAALIDHPMRFILQTPNDGYPFMSLAMSVKGHIAKGIFSYDSDEFDLIRIMPGETLYSGWRSDGLQIVSIPQAILRAHSAWLARTISQTLRILQSVEKALTKEHVEDFFSLQRTLHDCQDTILKLERRSQFEDLMIAAIESCVHKSRYSKDGAWPALAPAKAAVQLRRVDLDLIPRRIESARVAINDNILQRTQLQSLAIAQSTQHIAEATMKDSAAMKTISIMTMIFLPGTAVASFFSMTMWNWNASDGSSLVSPWLWIYFAVATPLTLGVIGVWYFWMLLRARQLRMFLPTAVTCAPAYTAQVANNKMD